MKMRIVALVLLFAFVTAANHLAAQAIDWSRAAENTAEAEALRPVRMDATDREPRISAGAQATQERYYAAALEHRREVFAWQALASKVIFWMVIFLVFSGSALSAAQFYFAMRRETADTTQELEISPVAIKIRSQFLGVVTLALSLAFFYLYLVNVFPVVRINTVPSAGAPRVTTTAGNAR